jgi:hypothetical protein
MTSFATELEAAVVDAREILDHSRAIRDALRRARHATSQGGQKTQRRDRNGRPIGLPPWAMNTPGAFGYDEPGSHGPGVTPGSSGGG